MQQRKLAVEENNNSQQSVIVKVEAKHQLLADEHRTPQAVIDQLVIDDATSTPNIRQYGIAAFDSTGHPVTAGYTGAGCSDYKNHILGAYYAVQGNILLGQQILDSIESRFIHTAGTMADRLMAALQGANVPGADTRCMTEGIPAQSSFIRVAKPTDTDSNLYLNFLVKSRPYGMSPVDSLQTLFNAWKLSLPTSVRVVTDDGMKVYPNPAHSVCNLQFEVGKERRVEVFDVMGHRVLERTCFAYCQLSTANGQSGVYFIKTGSAVQKLLVQ